MRARTIHNVLTAAVSTLLVATCDRPRDVLMTGPRPNTVRLAAPDPGFRLNAGDRAALRPGFDADALERLLAAIEPGARPDLLRSFQMPAPGERVRNTVRMGDPALQPLLDEVWLPFWEAQPARLRKHYPDDDQWPGLELARRRAGIAHRD